MEPKVFISYSHDDEPHIVWVKKLATDLLNHGVDTTLDQWDLRIGDNIPKFMEQIRNYPYVICVCSTNYVNKSNDSNGGTGYEKNILADYILNHPTLVTVIPIIRNNITKNLPVFLSGTNFLDFNEDSDYASTLDKLVERLYNFDKRQKPLLGKSLNAVDADDWVATKNLFELNKYQNRSNEGSISFDFKNNNGIYEIGSGDYIFNTKWSECGANAIYAYSDKVQTIGYKSNVINFPSHEDIKPFDYTSKTRRVPLGECLIWQNNHNHFAVTKVTEISVKSRGATEDKLTFDYIIFHKELFT